MTDRHIAVYPVGVLHGILTDWRMVTRSGRRPVYTARALRMVWTHARARSWRTVRNSFNGYLAEHEYAGTRCGHGWTKGRALRDLRRHLAEIERSRR